MSVDVSFIISANILALSAAHELIDSDWLIVGIAINHPRAGRKGGEKNKRSMTDGRSGDTDQTKPPSIVGYSANIGSKNAFEFVGGLSCAGVIVMVRI